MEFLVAESVLVPEWVRDLDSFRHWCSSADFPEEGRISYFDGQLYVDPAMERRLHTQIKVAITAVLFALIRLERLGCFYPDRMRLVHPEANLSTEPDGMFVSKESLQRQRVQLREGDDSLEVTGSPDMALEVVSPTSVQKDTVRLLELYHRAGIREYWLVDSLGEQAELKIYRHTPKKFVATRPNRGWLRSEVFGKSFRLTEAKNEADLREFTLEVR